MRKASARFELHSAGKMRIEDLFVDSQAETGVSIPTNVRQRQVEGERVRRPPPLDGCAILFLGYGLRDAERCLRQRDERAGCRRKHLAACVRLQLEDA